MPRPKSGYQNAAGLKIPGTGDINGRFMNRTRLLYWAFNRGKEGHPKLYDNSALDIGTCVHGMAELDLKGRAADDIEFYAKTTLPDPEQLGKAKAAFASFKAWRAKFHVEPYAQEVSLVSEKYQFGGTIDLVAKINNGLALLDFKSCGPSAEVFEDHLLQMAAYGILWHENHFDLPLVAGYHLNLLPKDGSEPVHKHYSHPYLELYREKFLGYRRLYDLDLICNDPKMLAGGAVAPSVAPAAKVKPIEIEPWAQPSTIGELLRSYGHVGNGASA